MTVTVYDKGFPFSIGKTNISFEVEATKYHVSLYDLHTDLNVSTANGDTCAINQSLWIYSKSPHYNLQQNIFVKTYSFLFRFVMQL